TEGRTATANATLGVAARLAITTLHLAPAKLGRSYRTRLATVGGVQPVAWKAVGGHLPHGVRFTKSPAALAGTPRRAGTFRLSLEARDSLGAKAQRKLVLRVTT